MEGGEGAVAGKGRHAISAFWGLAAMGPAKNYSEFMQRNNNNKKDCSIIYVVEWIYFFKGV